MQVGARLVREVVEREAVAEEGLQRGGDAGAGTKFCKGRRDGVWVYPVGRWVE